MAYTNKIHAAVVTAVVVFLAVAISPQWTEAQTLPKLDPVCALVISDIVQNCYLAGNLVPSDECCKDLKSANTAQVNCVCENLIAHPSNNNLTQALFDVVHTTCDVRDKFACKGGDSNGGGSNGGDSNGGAMNKIAAAMGLLGLVASLLF